MQAALRIFREAPPLTNPRQILLEIFTTANLEIYDSGMIEREQGRGATTMTAAIFRDNEVTLGNVGDSRAYLIRGSTITRLTTDHSYRACRSRWDSSTRPRP